ncbi:DUF5703 family protein [Raineyella antarctica]|uniref:DUF5703 family protein n=1 Tax=Raineyella antarctica TaxID=1577474 RepID=UPI001FE1A9DA|nr:DUF5703 family protein [Raineyella antarctica]
MTTRTRVRQRPDADYDVRRLTIDREMSRNALRQMLTEEAEREGWELHRLRRYRDGRREVWMRRRIIRVRATWESYPE